MKKFDELPIAVAYCRFSSNNQREESIDAQIRMIDEFSKNKYSIVHWYKDSAQSAKTDNRTAFQEMIKDVKDGNKYKAKFLIVSKRDRFARNRYDMAYYKRELAKVGITIISVTENQLDNSPESIILESVLDGMSEYYSKNLARETIKGLKENAFNGKITGSTPPLGLKANKETLTYEIDEPNAEAIRILFNRFVYDRWSYKQIAEELNSKGYRTAWGNEFTAKSSMIDLLRNSKYEGTLTYLKTRTNPITGKRSNKLQYNDEEIISTEYAIPPIIDKVTFRKAQELLTERRHKGGCFKSQRRNLFVGKIFCGICGNCMSMNSRKSGKGESYTTYRCSGKNEKLAMKCTNREISFDHLERYIISQLMYFITQENTVDKITVLLNEVIRNGTTKSENDVELLKSRISNLDVKKQNITNLLVDSPTSATKVLVEKLDSLECEQEELISKLMELEIVKPVIKEINRNEVLELLVKAKGYMESKKDDLIRAVIELFVEKIVIGEEGVEIVYYLQPFSVFRRNLWTTYQSRENIKTYKGLFPSLLRGKLSKRAILKLNNTKPSLSQVISLV